ncbi:carboxy-terminal domain transketolase (macronuclear) [Tetrahymena thermophila SB210]|uniref:Carboxy-terminal domain transketolase n=1 Tax=Tetrahymena thermophila (strain SB210) TaxID=312017 RepID=Q231N2_TETTS|nr:carboxy-terminal domain transketolase [Tetrahymena thermophila SB210]EAR91270.3 carboxy-terminal domain transketolase [Tetrahymena thermophila SB210]|eukprot:XP_001011515.3 carboxy-terminal domain transketolase [Tetrahymena thermophila SB210]
MGSQHKAGNFKQKNKKFKGAKTATKTHKIETKTKKITKKNTSLNKSARKLYLEQQKFNKSVKREDQIEKLINQNSVLDSATKSAFIEMAKQSKAPRIVYLLPLNNAANTKQLRQEIEQYISSQMSKHEDIEMMDKTTASNQDDGKMRFKFPYYQFFAHPTYFPGLIKENFIIIEGDRVFENIMDFCKIADIVCPVLSCKDANLEKLNLDPYNNANAFDEWGYKILSALRLQGLPSTISVLQDVNTIPQGKQKDVKKLFQRYFASEFEDHFVSIENEQSIFTLLRQLQARTLLPYDWKEQRGYMLADEVTVNPTNGVVEITGFLRGHCINANQLIHITGYDDYEIQKIEILKNPIKIKQKIKKKGNGMNETNMSMINFNSDILLTQEATDPDQINPFAKDSGLTKKKSKKHSSTANILKGIDENEEIDNENSDIEEEGDEEEEEEEVEEQEEEEKNKGNIEEEGDIEIEGEDEEDNITINSDDENQQKCEGDKKQKILELQERGEDELELEDEVEYATTINLRERYENYQGMKSFKTSEWDKYENLPDPYEKVYVFKNYIRTKNTAFLHAEEQAFAYAGFYIKIYVKGFPLDKLSAHPKEKALILSTLLKHERKMTVLHARVKRNIEYEDKAVESKQNYVIHMGFRRAVVNSIFSKIYNNNDKTKYVKKVKELNQFYMASFYYYNIYPPANIIMFNEGGDILNADFCLSGQVMKSDPLQVVLKRIILTGYPFKIHKRKAVCRLMFFNPLDIKYFQPVELKTKLGLRGKILESLGTHGLMKCLFSGFVKPHDTICMHLYKRVFPKAPF